MRAPRLRLIALFLFPACMTAASGTVAQVGSPAGPIPVDVLEERRSALLDSIGVGVAILRSAEPRSIEGDYPQDSDFRQDNDFFFLTGLETPGSWLVFVAREDSVDETILFVPPRNPDMERWTGPKPGPDSVVAARTGIRDVRSAEKAEEDIQRLLRGRSSPARTGGIYLKLGEDAGNDSFIRGLVFGRPAGTIHDLRVQLAQLRLVKDEEALRRLRRAIELTDEAHLAAMRIAEPGIYEYELEAAIEATFRRGGAERVGFPSIIGSGINSTVLHYDKNRRQTEAGDLVVMDIGAEYGYYSADITRTIPVSGRFTDRQQEVYELVLATQQAAIDSVRPGVTVRDLNRIARDYMKEHSGDICGEQTCDSRFIHGLSHWLGMDVHDVGDYNTPLMPGMVLTIEPGIYLPEEGFGVRIEDDILVTANGHELLSDGSPRDPEEIEEAMAQ